MMPSVSGIIRASKPTLRHWRDVRNREHLGYVAGYQNRVLPYLPYTNDTLVQKRRTSTAKALVDQDNHRIPKAVIPARRPSTLILRTLNRKQLAVEDYVDFTGKSVKSVRISVAPEEPGARMRYWRSGCIPFPPDSHGFLYWHLAPDAPPVSGQVRFRITKSSHPATFPSGRNLQLPDGRTWYISLFEIARASQYSGLRALLLSEELVTANVLDAALNISAPHRGRIIHPTTCSLLIWKLGQSFSVNLQSLEVCFWVIGSSGAEQGRLARPFSVQVRETGSTGIVQTVDRKPYIGVFLQLFFSCGTYGKPYNLQGELWFSSNAQPYRSTRTSELSFSVLSKSST
ncbi:hypothetical protein OE88DRAFT_1657249 [Heliocybe sulcata]|uniref:Uncharacterized protein n=1 Tax=Heliocybe sulcata TaxID=5364 RepID=A0A5C3N6N5_9AGAM|nr:hypothetical protein OE88DRAFT_1657249 [Heliocybe sulcata]